MPEDGLYLIGASHTHQNHVISYDDTNNEFQLTHLDEDLVRRSTFYIHHMAEHASYEIHNTHLDKSLTSSSGGAAQTGDGDSDEHGNYRWSISRSSSGGRTIANSAHSSRKLTAKGPVLVMKGGGTTPFPDYPGPWDLIRLDVGQQNQDGEDKLQGKSAQEWFDIAQEVFNEGLKLVDFACSDTWTERTAEQQESYVDLFKKFGEDKGLEWS
ncbi:hypothetical protein B0T26DRAFT_676824 [Lasiosphaeria miniovina]|uniref:Uncharacterized protein n=1 Tax=Lasiosphaeria miniovina TaxID=1954250 RepID=A0AA40AAM6_9PEZI|nr:uncharacterized protein B0T26DRAFT_676824 [Lasiosphaeria miniovina]KAK0712349.1 hypothetical protein B0T26DRAFT_676824 [Lasiosphaeria miniovina]